MLLRFSSILLLLVFLVGPCLVFAADEPGAESGSSFFNRSKEGWFWYQDPPPEPEEEEGEVGSPAAPPPKVYSDFQEEELWRMNPPEFQEVYTNTQNMAMGDPTPEKVGQWYRMVDIGRRRSLEFTHVAQYVLQTTPQLNFMKDSPLATPGRKALYKQQRYNREDMIQQANIDHGLLYFYQNGNLYCEEQTKILRRFSRDNNWDVRPVDVDSEPDLAAMFNIETLPTILLVKQDSPDAFPVGVGVVAKSELEENIFRGMRMLTGSVNPSQYGMYDFQKGTALDPMATRPDSEDGRALPQNGFIPQR